MRRRGAASHEFWIALGVSLSLHVLGGMLFWGTWKFSPMTTVEPEVEWTWSAPAPEKPVQGRGSVKELIEKRDEKQETSLPPVSSDSSVPRQESKAATPPAAAAGTPSQKPAPPKKTPEAATGPVAAQGSSEKPLDTIEGESSGFALIPPKIKERPPLLAPEAARDALTGDVLLSVEVLENGNVGKIVLGRSSGSKILDEAARENVSRWRFEPARQPQGQKPVRVLTSIWVRFSKEGS